MRIPAPAIAELTHQLLTDEGVHGGDILLGGRLPGADRPDRFVGYHAREWLRQTAGDLPADNFRLLTRAPLVLCLANTDDWRETSFHCCQHFLADQFVGLARGSDGARNDQG